jgi:hypothetical protein
MPRRPKVKRPLTIADLPAPSTNRWVIRRKAQVLAAVHGGLVEIKPLRQAISVGSGRRLAAANRPNRTRLKPGALSARRRRRKGQNGKENRDR